MTKEKQQDDKYEERKLSQNEAESELEREREMVWKTTDDNR